MIAVAPKPGLLEVHHHACSVIARRLALVSWLLAEIEIRG